MRALLIGHGRMGRLVEQLAPDHGIEVAGVLTSAGNAGGAAIVAARWRDIDVAIDFSTASAVPDNFQRLATGGVSMVIGTTGWQAHEPLLRHVAATTGIGVVAAANFSLGVALFQAIVERAAVAFAARPEYGAWIHEQHHAAKRDAPSGTALVLRAAMERSGYDRPIDVSATRAGSIPGTHTVGFDGPADAITLIHTARDRSAFARGALEAARWLAGRTGWFTIQDVIGMRDAGAFAGAAPARDEGPPRGGDPT
jgi:4-hydroxy-tetrahydrodipicolinate reductase